MNDEGKLLVVAITQQLGYSQKQAAAMLGVSVSHFQRHVRPELPVPKIVGGRLVFRHKDLERWLDKR